MRSDFPRRDLGLHCLISADEVDFPAVQINAEVQLVIIVLVLLLQLFCFHLQFVFETLPEVIVGGVENLVDASQRIGELGDFYFLCHYIYFKIYNNY